MRFRPTQCWPPLHVKVATKLLHVEEIASSVPWAMHRARPWLMGQREGDGAPLRSCGLRLVNLRCNTRYYVISMLNGPRLLHNLMYPSWHLILRKILPLKCAAETNLQQLVFVLTLSPKCVPVCYFNVFAVTAKPTHSNSAFALCAVCPQTRLVGFASDVSSIRNKKACQVNSFCKEALRSVRKCRMWLCSIPPVNYCCYHILILQQGAPLGNEASISPCR